MEEQEKGDPFSSVKNFNNSSNYINGGMHSFYHTKSRNEEKDVQRESSRYVLFNY